MRVERRVWEAELQARLGLSCHPAFLRLRVEDEGPGMDPETLSRCTQPVFTTRHARLGLGLAAARGMSEACGGRLVVKSQRGRGTRVDLWLPAAS